MTYEVVVTIMAALLVIWALYWTFNPFRCTCGKTIWTKHGMKKHLYTTHKWEK